jgi:dihydroorotate dehydrogenase
MTPKRTSRLFRPWLWLPSRLAHDLVPHTLPLAAKIFKKGSDEYRPFQWRGLSFKNPMGLAGGADKSGKSLTAWENLGVGFLEVGTVTPEPQGPNPGKIMDRDLKHSALWNKMGFPNPGLEALISQLEKKSFKVPLFINIGKNRWTKNEEAYHDYAACMKGLHKFADAFVVNLSSPNTKGLRDLLEKKPLQEFLENTAGQMKELKIDKPLLLKLSPDMTQEALQTTLESSANFVDGWILTNTTKSRFPGCPFPAEEGGLSGEPLKTLSLQALKAAQPIKQKHPDKLLISVGGVGSAEDVKERLESGADLVQCYSALVFHGPGFFRNVLSQLQSNPS